MARKTEENRKPYTKQICENLNVEVAYLPSLTNNRPLGKRLGDDDDDDNDNGHRQWAMDKTTSCASVGLGCKHLQSMFL